jgi:hypothetical protein
LASTGFSGFLKTIWLKFKIWKILLKKLEALRRIVIKNIMKLMIFSWLKNIQSKIGDKSKEKKHEEMTFQEI